MQYPKISIITPSYNQGEFIEDTILSVLGQYYPNLEYIIIDGGSTDGTVEIIKKYERHLAYWISEKDEGQSHAINKGFDIATGEILAWLNSDDMYMPNTLNYISKLFEQNELKIIFGQCIHFENSHGVLNTLGSDVINNQYDDLSLYDYVIQPSSFWTKAVWEKVGKLHIHQHFGFDWEWFLRAKRGNINFQAVNRVLSLYRFHPNFKTGTGGQKRNYELLDIYEQYNNHYYNLFKHILDEKFNMYSFAGKLIIRFYKFFKIKYSYGKLLKLFKNKKYSKFTIKEIDTLRGMLS